MTTDDRLEASTASGEGSHLAHAKGVTKGLRSLVVVLTAICACAAPQRPARAPAPASTEGKPPARALEGLASATRALGATTAGEAHRDVATAVTALAGAMERDPASRVQAVQVRELGARLAAASEPANDHAELVRQALDTASRALEDRAHSSGPMSAQLTAAFAASEAAVRSLEDSRALTDQRERVVAGFEAITDAVFLLHRRRAPFPLAIESGGATRTPAIALAAARRDALAIARAPWIAADAGTAALVLDLADMLAVLDGADVREGVAGLRLDAQRLSNVDAPTFDRARRLKRALRSALDLLATTGVDPMWVSDARDAVAGIDPHGAITFQRSEIQDAVRATVAAFAAADLAQRSARIEP